MGKIVEGVCVYPSLSLSLSLSHTHIHTHIQTNIHTLSALLFHMHCTHRIHHITNPINRQTRLSNIGRQHHFPGRGGSLLKNLGLLLRGEGGIDGTDDQFLDA